MLLLAALNPGPALSLRLLTSRSPALPLGLWLAAAAAGGAALSALATGLALRQGRTAPRPAAAGRPGRRQPQAEPAWSPAWSTEARRGPGRQRGMAGGDAPAAGAASYGSAAPAGPERAPGEPPPTLSVPFRVIRRAAGAADAADPDAGDPDAVGGRRGRPGPAPAGGSAATAAPERGDDWEESPEQDW
ncbi:MAG: hypothetical protein VKJ44_05145 [Synechococcus sp.]|nr:hypothetical protein [Synechococcus sp.]